MKNALYEIGQNVANKSKTFTYKILAVRIEFNQFVYDTLTVGRIEDGFVEAIQNDIHYRSVQENALIDLLGAGIKSGYLD